MMADATPPADGLILPYKMSDNAAQFLDQNVLHWWDYYVVRKDINPELKEAVLKLKKELSTLEEYYAEIEPVLMQFFKSSDKALEIIILPRFKQVWTNALKDTDCIK